ncbi:hypothetical protein OK016_20095 [Vibrio chagasii]|nr:hypothetical protein [Vibrio chagasii]
MIVAISGVGSLSKVMFNGLRLPYLVVPEHLVAKCLEIKDAPSGDTASHTQEALAFDFVRTKAARHLSLAIPTSRRSYKLKYEAMIDAIESEFKGDLEVISQAAGLHDRQMEWWHF